MPLHIFKKLFPGVTNEQLAETINKHILLKTYNKTTITQLGMCKVMIEHENNRKRCQFFVVAGNGHALLGMPDTDALQIINKNIDSIDAEDAENGEQYINTNTTQESNKKQDQWLILTQINQQTTFFQVQTVMQTKGRVLN